MTLDKLPEHKSARILSLEMSSVAQRLMAMGFLPGESVRVIQVAPFGDPITVALDGFRVSMRRSEAALVGVALEESPS